MAPHRLNTVFLLLWIAAAVFAVSRAPDAVMRRFEAHPRVFGTGRSRVAFAGVLMCVAGFGFLMGWLTVRLPGRGDDIIDSQPAPPGLWQAAAVLFGLGLVTLIVTFLTAPEDGDPGKPLNNSAALVGTMGAMAVPLLIATGTATRSKLQQRPLIVAGLMVVVCLFLARGEFAHADRGPFGKVNNLTDAIASALATHLWPVIEGYDLAAALRSR